MSRESSDEVTVSESLVEQLLMIAETYDDIMDTMRFDVSSVRATILEAKQAGIKSLREPE